MSLQPIEKEYISLLEEKLDKDDTLHYEIKKKIKLYITNLNSGNLFKTIIFINRTKNKIALDMLNQKIVLVIIPSEILGPNEYYTEDQFITIFSNGLLNKTGEKSKAYTNFVEEMNKIINEYEYDYYSNDNFDNTILYFRLGKIASNFNCQSNKYIIPNYINILTCVSAFNKIKIIKEEYKKLMDSVVITLYRCFGFRKSMAETYRTIVGNYYEDSIGVKENKAKIAGTIILHKDMISQNICSIKEFSLIKKNTLFFDSVNGKVIQGIAAPLAVTLMAIGIATICASVSSIPVVGGLTSFPLYVTPLIGIVGSLLGTNVNSSQFYKDCLENINKKSQTKTFFSKYIKTNETILREDVDKCKDGYVVFVDKFIEYTKCTNKNYDFFNFKKHIYCELYSLLCKTSIISDFDEELDIVERDVEVEPKPDQISLKCEEIANNLNLYYVVKNDLKKEENKEKYANFLKTLEELKEMLNLEDCNLNKITNIREQLDPITKILYLTSESNLQYKKKEIKNFLCNKSGGKTKKNHNKKTNRRNKIGKRKTLRK